MHYHQSKEKSGGINPIFQGGKSMSELLLNVILYRKDAYVL
ncbi:hypothetical protein STRDD13_00107 [Streptococcus sp. DD13]|nr:hypothetical protein STRDD13_00107 [Streptococcus sp. DD13]